MVNVIVNNPLSNARQWFGTVVVALALALPIFRTMFGKVAFVACMLIGTALLFSLGNAVRYTTYSNRIPQSSIVQTWQLSGDYDAATEVTAAVDYAEINGLSYGRQLAGDVLFWVPQRFWRTNPLQPAISSVTSMTPVRPTLLPHFGRRAI